MDVSIIIINYNTFQLTLECLQSIRKLAKDLNYEIILVDNNSTERDPDEFLQYDNSILLIKSKTNLGFAKGNNLGLGYAQGKYILLINSDAALKNDAVGMLKKFLDTHPEVAVATCRLEYPDGRVQHNCQRFPNISFQLIELFRLQKIFPSIKNKLFGPYFSYDRVAYPDWIWGTFFMFPKSLLDKLPNKKLADDFFMYVEDMQWCMDFKCLGYEIAFCPDGHLIHQIGSSGGEKNELIKKNIIAFLARYYPSWKRILIRILNRVLTFQHATD